MGILFMDYIKKWKESQENVKASHKTSVSITAEESALCASMRLKLGLKNKSQFVRFAIQLASDKIESIEQQILSTYVDLRKCAGFSDEDNKTIIPKRKLFDSEEACDETIKIFARDDESLTKIGAAIERLELKDKNGYLSAAINEFPDLSLLIKSLSSDKADLIHKKRTLDAKNVDLQSTVNELENQCLGKKQEVDSLKDVVNDLESEIAMLEKTLFKARSKIASLKERNASLAVEANAGPFSRMIKMIRKKNG